MVNDFYCPKCGAFQARVDLEETDNTFVCSECKSIIHFEKSADDISVAKFTVYSTDE